MSKPKQFSKPLASGRAKASKSVRAHRSYDFSHLRTINQKGEVQAGEVQSLSNPQLSAKDAAAFIIAAGKKARGDG